VCNTGRELRDLMVRIFLKKIASALFSVEAKEAQPAVHRVAARPRPVTGPAASPAVSQGTRAADNDGPAPRPSVEQRLQTLVTATPTKVVAGRVQLLGLAEVRAALGERWDRHGSIISDMIEGTIQRRLAPTDVYQRDRQGDFTICFSELSESDAAFKARAIAEEIRAKILGRDWDHGSTPLTAEANAFLDEVAVDAAQRQTLVVHGEAHEVELGVDEVEESDDLLGLLTLRLEAAAERSKRTERGALIEIAENSALELHPVETIRGEVAPFQFATFDTATRDKVDALRRGRPFSPDLIRDLDVLLISKAAEEVLGRPPGKGTVLIVNIHFSTIDNKRRLEHVSKLCRTLPEAARSALIFNIVEIPADLLPAIVAEQFHQVRSFCRTMMAECPGLSLRNLDPLMLRTPVLTFNAAHFASEIAHDVDAASAFLRALRLKRLRLLVYGSATARQRGQIKAVGVEFLALG